MDLGIIKIINHKMKKVVFLFFIIASYTSGICQQSISTNLSLERSGKYLLELNSYFKMYSENEVFMEDGQNEKYEIEVLSVLDNGYLIKWNSKNTIDLKQNKINDEIAHKLINNLGYEIMIDQCGKFKSVTNIDKLQEEYLQKITTMVNGTQFSEDLKVEQVNKYQLLFNDKDKVYNAAKNLIDIIFSEFCKQYTFGEQTLEKLTMSIGSEVIIDTPVEILSKVKSYKDDICVINFDYKYDKESLSSLNTKEMKLLMEYCFDIEKGWLKYIKTNSEIVKEGYVISHTEEYKFL